MNEQTENGEKLKQLQLVEQNLQISLQQKQQFQAQLLEVETAIKEIAKTDDAFKIIGNIMVHSPNDVLKKELDQKKEIFDLRIQTIEKQEGALKEKFNKLQSEVLGEMKQ